MISGRVLSVNTWAMAHRSCRVMLALFALLLVAAATEKQWTTPLLKWLGPESAWRSLVVFPMAISQWADDLARRFPEQAALIYYAHHPINWHLLLAVLFTKRLLRPMGSLVAFTALLIGRPFLASCFTILIGETEVRIRCGWARVRLQRHGHEPVTVRVATPEEYYSQFGKRRYVPPGRRKPFLSLELEPHPPAVVEFQQGMKRYKMVFARWGDEAEAIVARCSEALRQSSVTVDPLAHFRRA